MIAVTGRRVNTPARWYVLQKGTEQKRTLQKNSKSFQEKGDKTSRTTGNQWKKGQPRATFSTRKIRAKGQTSGK